MKCKEKICANCKYYEQGDKEENDLCHHEKAYKGGVRSSGFYRCCSMISVGATCFGNKLFDYRFADVSCSQCGNSFGPGGSGYSYCENHKDEAK